MKVLLDTCVWGGVKQLLVDAGHDVVWTGDWEKDPGDDEILAIAHREGRVLITLDKDFGELAIVFGQPHSGIVRLVNMSTKQQGEVCMAVLGRYESTAGCFDYCGTRSGQSSRVNFPGAVFTKQPRAIVAPFSTLIRYINRNFLAYGLYDIPWRRP